MTSIGSATLDLRLVTTAVAAQAQQAARQMQKAFESVVVKPKVDFTQTLSDLRKVRDQAQKELRAALTVNITGLDQIATRITTIKNDLNAVAGELRDAAQKLKEARAGTSGSGTGGGSPGRSASGGVSGEYAAQLRALQGDLRAGTTSTAQFEAATRALKASIDAEIASLRNAGVLTREQQGRLDSLRAASGQAGQALRQMGDQAARAAQQAAQASARAQSEGISRLSRELQVAQSQYERGALGLRAYLREMERIRTAGQGMAAGLQAGSREAQALERVMAGLSGATRNINAQSITQLRSGIAAARAEFERATAAANGFAARRAAVQAYNDTLRQIEQQIAKVGQRTTITTAQMGELNRLTAQVRSGLNTVNNAPSGAGFAGGIMAALRQLPQFAMQAGGSLGAAAMQASTFGQGLGGITREAGPLGLAIGAVAIAVAGFAAILRTTVGPAAQFEQTLVDIKALTQPTVAELAELREATMDIGRPLGVGAREAAAAVLELNRAGLTAADAVGGGLAGALTLAGAAGEDAAAGARQAVGAMTAFGLAGRDLPRIADVFANFANKTFLGAEDLSLALAAVGPVARSAGLSLEEFSGYMATLAQGGFRHMSDAGTSLKSMLLSLQAPSTTAAGAIKDIKLQVYDAAGKMRPLGTILDDLRVKLAGMNEQGRNRALKDIFGTDGIRAATIFMGDYSKSLDENSQRIRDNISAMGLQGEAARVAEERNKSFQGQMRILRATWDELVITIGERFLPVLTSAVSGLSDLLQQFQTGGPKAQQFKTVLEGIGLALLVIKRNAIAAFAASIWSGLVGGAGAAGNVGRLGLAVRGLGTALGGIPGILAAVAAAFGIWASSVINDIQRVQDEVAASEQQSQDSLMAQVKKLREAGDAYSLAKARYLLSFATLQDAQRGVPQVGFFGEITYKPDPAAVAQAQKNFDAAKLGLEAARQSGARPLVGQGPLMPGQKRIDPQAQAGKFAYDYIASLADVFQNDPKVASDCASIAYAILDNLGLSIKGTRMQNVNAGVLEKSAIASGFTTVPVDQMKPGDLIVWTSGNGRQYGAVSGKHVGVAAGMKNGVQQVINNPGTSNTVVEAMYDRRNAVVYRAPTSPFAAGGPGATNRPSTTPASAEALKKEALRILTAIQKYEKEGKLDEKIAAESVLNRFIKSGPRAAAAVDLMRGQLGSLRRETSQFGQTFDRLKDQLSTADSTFKLTDNAQAYIKSLNGISAAAKAAADADKKAHGETDKYRALLDLAGDTAQKARQQQDALARGTTRATTAASREAAQAAARQKARNDLLAQLDKDLADGKKIQTQAVVDQLQQALQTELAAHKNNAAERLRVEQQLGPKILAAQKRVLEAERDAAVKAARAEAQSRRDALTKQYGKGKEPKDLLAGIAQVEMTAVGNAEKAFQTKLSTLYSASAERINSATAAVQAKNKQVAEQRVQTEQQVQQQLASMNDAERQAAVQRAQDDLTRLKNDRQARIDAAKGNAAALLQIEKDTAGKIRAQEERVALTVLIAAKRKADDAKAAALAAIPKGATQAERDLLTQKVETARLDAISTAYRAYSLTVGQSAQAATQAVRTATENQQQALTSLQGKYESLLASFDKKVQDGSVTDEDTQAYWRDLNALFRDATSAGLALDPVIVRLRDRARELGETAPGVREALGVVEDIAQTLNDDSESIADSVTRDRFGLGADGLAAALKEYGAVSVDELEVWNKAAAASLRRVYAGVFAQMEADMQAAADRSIAILENYRAEAEALADQVQITSDAALTEKDEADRNRVKGLQKVGPAAMLNFLGGAGNEFFGDRFWTQLGESGRADFLAAFEEFKPEQLGRLGVSFLRGLRDRIDPKDPTFASLRARIDQGISSAQSTDLKKSNYSDLSAVVGRFAELDSSSADYAGTIADELIPELQRVLSIAEDPDVRASVQATIDALKGEVDAVRQLAALKLDTDLAELDRKKALGQIGEQAYLRRREEILLAQEEARYQLDIKDKTGKALELAEAQHQANMARIRGDTTVAALDNIHAATDALASAQRELAQAMGQSDPAYRAQIEGLEALKKKYPEIATEIDKLIGKYRALQKADPLTQGLKAGAQIMGKNSPLQAGISSAMEGLAAFFGAGGKEGGSKAILTGAASFVGGLVDVFKTGDEDIDKVVSTFVSGLQGTLMQLAQGNWIGALVAGVATVVSTIVDIFTGGANSARKAREQIDAATKSVKFFDLSKYAKTVSVGGFWGWLGFKKSEIDQEAVDIAQTLGDALYSGISSGMLDGIKAGKANFSELNLDLRQELGQTVLQGLIDGFLKSAVMQGILQPFLDQYITAMKSGNAQALAEAATGIQNAVGQANSAVSQFYNDVLVPTGRSLGIFDTDQTATGTRTPNLGITELPASVQVRLQQGAALGQQTVQSAGLFHQAAERFDRTVRTLQERGLSADLTLTQPLPEVRTRMRSGALLNG